MIRRYAKELSTKLLDLIELVGSFSTSQLKRVLRVLLSPVREYRRRTLYLQAALVLGAFLIRLWIPIVPGIAIGFSGFVAAVMALDGLTKREKFVWVIFAFALLIVEVVVVESEHTKNEQEQAQMRIREDNARESEQNSFANLIGEGKRLFDNEALISNETRDLFTGGDSYVMVTPNLALPIGNANTFSLAAIIGGKSPERNSMADTSIYVFKLPIANAGTIGEAMDAITGANPEEVPVFSGTINPTVAFILPKRITPSLTGITEYTIRVFSRNWPTVELLRIRKNPINGVWEYSSKVQRVINERKRQRLQTLEVTNPEWRSQVIVQVGKQR